jgi:hypothetical protein
MKTIRTDRAREDFLTALRKSCNVSASCRAAGIARSAAYAWRNEDEQFAAEWADAEGEAVDDLEGVAYARAMAGESDRMVEILLKGHRPERYAPPAKVKHVGGDDGDNPIAFTGWDITFGT